MDRHPCLQAILNMLMMVIHESLRLYPPVQVVSREAITDTKFGGIHVPKWGEGMEPAGDTAHRT
uniref:Uncharacterized protein n=1 Tax=Vitis vinifera TaxID=29760 RepID=F6GVZ5_VITVI